MSARKQIYTREQMAKELLDMDARIIDGSDIFKQAATMIEEGDNVRAAQERSPTDKEMAQGAEIIQLQRTIIGLKSELDFVLNARRLSRDLQEDWWDLKRLLEERVDELHESKRVYMESMAHANAKLRLAGIAAVPGPEMSPTDVAALAVKHGKTATQVKKVLAPDIAKGDETVWAWAGPVEVYHHEPKVSLHSMTANQDQDNVRAAQERSPTDKIVEFPNGRFAEPGKGGV